MPIGMCVCIFMCRHFLLIILKKKDMQPYENVALLPLRIEYIYIYCRSLGMAPLHWFLFMNDCYEGFEALIEKARTSCVCRRILTCADVC